MVNGKTALRQPAVAGSFYPDDAKELREYIARVVAGPVPKSGTAHTPGSYPKAIIVPHAGYLYSGAVAGKAYALLKGSPAKRVILVGPSHFVAFDGSVTSAEQWKTPLGTVQVVPLAGLNVGEAPFRREHSLEVQLPFLQTVLPSATMTPVLVGDEDPHRLADIVLKDCADSIIVVSSDLSHYLPYAKASAVDKSSINAILAKAVDGDIDACGSLPIRTVLIIAKKRGWKASLVDYKNSGDTAGSKEEVVGYAAIEFR